MDESSREAIDALQPYRVVLQEFMSGAISADQFEASYTTRYLADEALWPPKLFDILDELFADVDDYVSDGELRADVGGLDGPELRARAEAALHRLDQYGLEAGDGSGRTG